MSEETIKELQLQLSEWEQRYWKIVAEVSALQNKITDLELENEDLEWELRRLQKEDLP